ncbi:MAG: TrbG/VirB9 family P-type conjugative transfer protein [Alphaproteobacteria bacterium]|nr:TrbG/VirB9 family P-type conjugative transfer protein [Alphaproteobacteria bacterium]
MKISFSLVICLLFSTVASAEELPKAGNSDERVRWVNYNPWEVVNIHTVSRTVTKITVSENEAIMQVSLGDTLGWETVVAGNNVLLKPREIHPPTNMTIITRRPTGAFRSYQFYIEAREGEITQNSGAFFAINFKYPQDEEEQRKAEAEARRIALEQRKTIINLSFDGPKNWAYTGEGNPDLEPTEVSDNGQLTFMTFPGKFPVIYAVSSDGTEEIIPFTTEGNTVILHSVAPQWRLRQGKQVFCVWNEAYNTKTSTPTTGTINNNIERVIRSLP